MKKIVTLEQMTSPRNENGIGTPSCYAIMIGSEQVGAVFGPSWRRHVLPSKNKLPGWVIADYRKGGMIVTGGFGTWDNARDRVFESFKPPSPMVGESESRSDTIKDAIEEAAEKMCFDLEHLDRLSLKEIFRACEAEGATVYWGCWSESDLASVYRSPRS